MHMDDDDEVFTYTYVKSIPFFWPMRPNENECTDTAASMTWALEFPPIYVYSVQKRYYTNFHYTKVIDWCVHN